MKRSELNSMPEYFDRYINKCDDVEILEAIQTGIIELQNAPLEKWKALGNQVYAPGKWTVKMILQHMIDTERIFCFRALAFARNEKQIVPPFDENEYALASLADNRTIESLVDELMVTHISMKTLFGSFTKDMLDKTGKGFKGDYSVASIGFILPGHQRWHFEILEDKYYPLIGK